LQRGRSRAAALTLSKTLVSVLNLAVNPGVTEVGDLPHEEEVIATERG
jgi:hypothetical protein